MRSAGQFPSWWKDDGNLIVLDCAIDESGDKKASRGNLLVVSAYIGSTEPMRKLSRTWTADLDLYGLPYFHAKELWKPQSKLFRKLSMGKRKALLASLVGHIDKRVDWGFSTYLNVDLYLAETTPRFRSQWGSPYTFLVRQIMNNLYAMLQRSNRAREPLNILLESGHANENQALGMLRDYEGPLNINTRGSGVKIGNPALQAADLLAYATCESVRGEHSKIKQALISKRHVAHYELNCNGKIVALTKGAIEAVYARRAAKWEAARVSLGDTDQSDVR